MGFFVVGVGILVFPILLILSHLNYVLHTPSKYGTIGFSSKFLLILLLPLARFLSLLRVWERLCVRHP